ncbi:AI-2E family transporter [Thiocapsa sp.]|uniref:AI-2E family transporter n=1 Tax=Thiocapsa sp. TaxID=2024551 RepID=UPI0035944013
MSDVPNSPPSAPSRVFSSVDRERLFIAFFFAAYFFLVYQLLLILTPFMAPLIAAVMLALVAYPVHRLIRRVVRWPNVAATLTTLLIMFTVVVPLSILIWLLLREAAAVIPVSRDWLVSHRDVGALLTRLDLPGPIAAIAETVRPWSASISISRGSRSTRCARPAMRSRGSARIWSRSSSSCCCT